MEPCDTRDLLSDHYAVHSVVLHVTLLIQLYLTSHLCIKSSTVEEFWTAVTSRRRPNADGTIRDICDGQAYQKHLGTGGFLTTPTNLSLTVNTDGAAVFKSSGLSLWPVYFIVNELPPELRYMHTA